MSVTAPSDSWGSPSTGFPAVVPQPHRPPESVKDDWDDDDESDGDEDPQKVWEDANKKAPMPELVISSTSATSAPATAVPAQALQPSLRILKRPSAPASPALATASSAEAQQKSLAEREAEYRAARERIFGSSSNPSSPPAETREPSSPPLGSAANPPPELAVKPIRNPRGPDSGGNSSSARGAGASRGFRGSNLRNTSTRGRPT
ncbi:uncharacterized protein PHACADRAFT_254064 [Phanerochaete carnosa HHB-10118-sp]|uniref:SUZ domain-containing protein n=1 Tax=Phanerochaete carnosa (strain HHB-10118-sp) TaxID=650164 RepID=K5V2K4_PHACS|nr:uncharacterized protein PHACADRAFT_254064 [Phanerochaete carnosa HHB-10118-sp]EKM56761.1 hypothetical protein PHACADRAFT_254064 [Phanerochaete carnosa HHB-10118-sp]